jgi:thioredoxin:protein disulfide reductase
MHKRVKNVAAWLIVVACLVGVGSRAAWAQPGAQKFVQATATAPKAVTPGKPFTVTIALNIDKPYHIQADKTKEGYIPTTVEVGQVPGFKVNKIVFPKAEEGNVAGEKLPVFEGKIAIKVTLTPDKTVKPGKVTLPITVKYQGCTDVTCFPPGKVEAKAEVNVGPSKPPRKTVGEGGDSSPPSSPVAQTDVGGSSLSVPGFQSTKITQFMPPDDFRKWLKEGGSEAGQAGVVADLLKKGGAGNFAGALGLIYLLGLALNLTPCVYPLIPITIGYFGRQASSGAKTGTLSIFYALGMALMYSALGVFAALAG